MLEKAPLPNDVIALGINEIRKNGTKKYVGEALLKIGQRSLTWEHGQHQTIDKQNEGI